MAKTACLAVAMAALAFAAGAQAQDISFNPDYIGAHAFSSSMEDEVDSDDREGDESGRHRDAADDQARVNEELRQLMQARLREIEPEYERRARLHGRDSANAWLREVATELGKRDGEAIRAGLGR